MKIALLGPAGPLVDVPPPICDFGVGEGFVLDAKVVDAIDSRGICNEGIPEYGPVGSWVWTLDDSASRRAGGEGPGVVGGYYVASNGACRGNLRVYLIPGASGDLFSAPDGGAPATLEVDYVVTTDPNTQSDGGANTANCPSDCHALFPIAVSRVE